MLPRNTKMILRFLAANGEQLHNINQIARELKISVSRTHEILKELESRDVVVAQPLGNAIFYSINKRNKTARLLLELIKSDGGI